MYVEWWPIETAPIGERVLVWGNGPARFGYRDNLGNWRKLHHAVMAALPTHWMPIPDAPAGVAGEGGDAKCSKEAE